MTEITKPPPGATIDYGHPINRGLLGWWLFNEGAGSRVADISGKGNHGTITNVGLTAGWVGSQHGGGLNFDGVDDHVVVPRSSLRPLTSMTAVAVINGSGVGADDYVLSHFITPGVQRSWAMVTSGTGAVLVVLLSGDGTNGLGSNKTYTSSDPFVAFDQASRQIAFTFDGPSSTLELFLDGHRDLNTSKSVDDAITSLHDSTTDVNFGMQGGDADHWDGSLSDVKIYNRALTQREIQQLNANPYLGILD